MPKEIWHGLRQVSASPAHVGNNISALIWWAANMARIMPSLQRGLQHMIACLFAQAASERQCSRRWLRTFQQTRGICAIRVLMKRKGNVICGQQLLGEMATGPPQCTQIPEAAKYISSKEDNAPPGSQRTRRP